MCNKVERPGRLVTECLRPRVPNFREPARRVGMKAAHSQEFIKKKILQLHAMFEKTVKPRQLRAGSLGPMAMSQPHELTPDLPRRECGITSSHNAHRLDCKPISRDKSEIITGTKLKGRIIPVLYALIQWCSLSHDLRPHSLRREGRACENHLQPTVLIA